LERERRCFLRRRWGLRGILDFKHNAGGQQGGQRGAKHAPRRGGRLGFQGGEGQAMFCRGEGVNMRLEGRGVLGVL